MGRAVHSRGRRNRAPKGAAAVESSEVLFVPAEAALADLSGTLDELRRLDAREAERAVPDLATFVLPFGVGMTLLIVLVGAWLVRSISGPLLRLNRTAQALVAGDSVVFRPEHDDEVGAPAEILERLRQDVGEDPHGRRADGRRDRAGALWPDQPVAGRGLEPRPRSRSSAR